MIDKLKIFLLVASVILAIGFVSTVDASSTLLYANPSEYRARIITGNSSSVRVDFENTGNYTVTIQIGRSMPLPLEPGQSIYYSPLDGNSTYYLSLSSNGENVPVRVYVSNGYIERGW